MRRLLGAVAAAMLVCTGLGAPPATAQESAVTMQLVSQTPVVTQYHRGMLDLQLLAINGGATTLRDLTMTVSFGAHLVTSADFEQVLTGELASAPIAHDEKELHFEIPAGVPQPIDMHVNVARLSGIDPTDSQVYPALIQLASAGTVLASLMTPMIYLVEMPPRPLLLSTWVQLAAPIAFGPDGTMIDPGFPAAIAEGGTLRAPLDTVAKITGGRHPHGALDLVLDPMLITQARDLADGYRTSDGTNVPAEQAAAEPDAFIKLLGRATAHPRTLETIAQPFADPIVPAMLRSGLGDQLTAQRDDGAAVVASLPPEQSGLQRTTDAVARPRDGRLSDEAVDWFGRDNGTIVLGNADTVDRTPFQDVFGSAPAPTVPTASGATLLLPDPTTQSLFDQTDLFTDPVRGAQIVLGELALIWKQAPSPAKPIRRGVAIAPPDTLPPAVWPQLLERVSDAPFLRPKTASHFVRRVNPSNPNGEAPLSTPDDSFLSPDYVARMVDLGRSVNAVGSMLPADDLTARDLRRRLYTATAPGYQFDPVAGTPWLDSVDATTSSFFAAAKPVGSEEFTFTSSEGTIALQFGNPGPTPLKILVELQSASFTYPRGNQRDATLDRPGVTVSFPVVAQGSGQSQIVAVVYAPDGQEISRTNITVRSTAVNSIALFITVGAGIGLVLLYARRWLRRRRNATT